MSLRFLVQLVYLSNLVLCRSQRGNQPKSRSIRTISNGPTPSFRFHRQNSGTQSRDISTKFTPNWLIPRGWTVSLESSWSAALTRGRAGKVISMFSSSSMVISCTDDTSVHRSHGEWGGNVRWIAVRIRDPRRNARNRALTRKRRRRNFDEGRILERTERLTSIRETVYADVSRGED